MSRNVDILAVGFIVLFAWIGSAVTSVAQHPLVNRVDTFIEQRIQDRIEPQLMKVHERIEQSIECGVERAISKLPSY